MKIIVSNNLDLKKYNHKKAVSLNSYNYRNKKNGYDNKEINIDFTKYNFYKKIDFEIDKKRFQDYKKNNSKYNTNRLITNLNGVWTFNVKDFDITNQKDRIKIANILINYLNNVIVRNLKDKKGNFIYNLLGYQLHLDEKNPHIHFQISTWNYLKNKYDKKSLTDPNNGLLSFKKIKNEENEYLNWLQQTKGYKYIKNIQNNKAVKILQSFRDKTRLLKEKEDKLFYNNLSLSISSYKNIINELNNFIDLLKKYKNNKIYFQEFKDKLNKLLNLFLNLHQKDFRFLWMFINCKKYTKKIINIFNENNEETKANLFKYLLNKTTDMKNINKEDINLIIKEMSL